MTNTLHDLTTAVTDSDDEFPSLVPLVPVTGPVGGEVGGQGRLGSVLQVRSTVQGSSLCHRPEYRCEWHLVLLSKSGNVTVSFTVTRGQNTSVSFLLPRRGPLTGPLTNPLKNL